MSQFTLKRSNKIDTIFILALITLFATTAIVLVLIGAKQYRLITDTMNQNHKKRTISSYLAEKIRQNDAINHVFISNLESVPALCILTEENEISYTTYIYYYNGALRELVVTKDSVFSLSSGQEIIELNDFTPELVDQKLIRTEITYTNGETQILYFFLHSGIGKDYS